MADVMNIYRNCLVSHDAVRFAELMEEIATIPEEIMTDFMEKREEEIKKEVMGLVRLKELIKINRLQESGKTTESQSLT